MDRNGYGNGYVYEKEVALHPEGVDRNPDEIGNAGKAAVALHPEGVDRNPFNLHSVTVQGMSPSTRRAWIEMRMPGVVRGEHKQVALHPEGVDRNWKDDALVASEISRPPPGGRG